VTFGALAQQGPLPYGPPITLEMAKKVATAAEAEAKKHGWPVSAVQSTQDAQLARAARTSSSPDRGAGGAARLASDGTPAGPGRKSRGRLTCLNGGLITSSIIPS